MNLSDIDAFFEAEYVEFKKNNPRQHYLYWIGKDRMRYFSELLNEMDKENKKPSGYPEISVKIFQILSIIVFFQISGPLPEKWLCVLVSLTSLSFPFCFVLNEIHQNKNGNRPVTQIEEFYQRLDGFISNMKEDTRNEENKKQQLKIRILALENNLFKLNIFILLLDILFNIFLIVGTIILLNRRVENGTKIFLDASCFIFGCGYHIIFSIIYLEVSFKNWKWLEKSKQELRFNC